MNTVRSFAKDKSNLNILSSSVHERQESMIAGTGFNFYNLLYEGCKPWRDIFAPIPKNYHLIKYVPRELDIDVVLSHHKFGQFQVLGKIARDYSLPLVSAEHTMPLLGWPESTRQQLRSMCGDVNVFISRYSAIAWGFDPDDASTKVVHHGVQTDIFKPDPTIEKVPRILSIANDYVNRDFALNYHGFRRVTEGLPTHVIGDTPGVSLPSTSVENLVEEYNKAQIFINTSTLSPIPSVILEAMSMSLPIVSTSTCAIPEFVVHGQGGFLSNDETELRKYTKMLLADKDMREEMGRFNYNRIREKFSLEQFVNNWKSIIRGVL